MGNLFYFGRYSINTALYYQRNRLDGRWVFSTVPLEAGHASANPIIMTD